MPKQVEFELQDIRPLTRDVFCMVLGGDTGAITAPGQFVQLSVPGCFLRRPISVADWQPGLLTLIFRVVGKGTARMAEMKAGDRLDLLTGLGNGYDLSACGKRPVLLGGGVGAPPLYGLARRLCERGLAPTVLLGFGGAGEVFYEKEFAALGCPVQVATGDGSYGRKGFVTGLLQGCGPFDYFYACGPGGMLRAVCEACAYPGQLSFEERMGCGFGACVGCTCQTKTGPKRICKEGPVLKKEELLW